MSSKKPVLQQCQQETITTIMSREKQGLEQCPGRNQNYNSVQQETKTTTMASTKQSLEQCPARNKD